MKRKWTSRAVKCANCGKWTDLQSIRSENIRHPIMQNTLNKLEDKNNVEWDCLKCGFVNGRGDSSNE